MTNDDAKALIELGMLLANRAGAVPVNKIAADVVRLHTLALRASTIAIAQCDYLETEEAEKRRAPVRAKANEILKPYRCTAVLYGDGRYCCFRIPELAGLHAGHDEGFPL